MRKDNNGLHTFEEVLSSKKAELRDRIEQRRMEIMVDSDPDDEGAQAVDRASRDFAAFNMEREIRTLAEIEWSLRRMAAGEYGFCTGCGGEIPIARLEALPWTRLCVECAGGGVERDLGRSRSFSAVALRRTNPTRVTSLGRR